MTSPGTPPIPHFGTTLFETPPAEGETQETQPYGDQLARTLRFEELFGFEPLYTNLYPGVGRQYIWRRGTRGDVDYVEKDAFTSYAAHYPPASADPRHGDTVFRLVHRDPVAVWQAWRAEGLVEPGGHADAEDLFLEGDADRILFTGPDRQGYELTPVFPSPRDNHAIFVWTDPGELDVIEKDFGRSFGLEPVERGADFHGIADAVVLARDRAPVTIGLLTPKSGGEVAPRLTDDVFAVVGFSHFRLGAPDKVAAQAAGRQAFPDTGDVSYVHFHHVYLELVQNP